ncbi:hypothetical protein HYALB_00008382 [Hymenoscyphus albidus]|uniref:Pyruvate decarboxylase n=1 Tax=Hymenoscyphus albidus TaxID=595503 RepID=A0A9N9LK88_9HELO|nr:hypothetical protein HYALB_00008382 [Hymenoscyphus albidus]
MSQRDGSSFHGRRLRPSHPQTAMRNSPRRRRNARAGSRNPQRLMRTSPRPDIRGYLPLHDRRRDARFENRVHPLDPDVPNQQEIVKQYCRYSAEIKSGKNVKQMVNRALQFATSDPAGPVYLCGAREVMEEDLTPYHLKQEEWSSVEPAALSEGAVARIGEALVKAREPLVITGYSGRNHDAVGALVKLADTVKGLRVLDTGGSDMCFPADHRAWLGLRYGVDECVKTADLILVLDCDVPWINTHNHPSHTAQIFHIDTDVLKRQMPVFYIAASARYSADSFTALTQLNNYISSSQSLTAYEDFHTKQWAKLLTSYETRMTNISIQAQPKENGSFGTGHLCATLRNLVPHDTIWAIEAVTNTPFAADNIRATIPGTWINCGGGGLGWSGGGALGIKLASTQIHGPNNPKFVVQIVGDGTFLFSVPSSVYWISQRYNLPILTIVLNNKGWNAPRKSMLLVHPDGLGSKVSNRELNIEIAGPDYAGIARAASGGWCFGGKVDSTGNLATVLREAVEAVKGGRTAVVEAVVEPGC